MKVITVEMKGREILELPKSVLFMTISHRMMLIAEGGRYDLSINTADKGVLKMKRSFRLKKPC